MIPSDSGATSKYAASDIDLFDAAPDGIIIIDEAGTVLMANEGIESMFGYASDELTGQPIEVLLPERFRDRHVTHRAQFRAHPSRRPMGLALSLFGQRKNGDEFPVDISLSDHRDAAGTFRVIAFVRDATARREMEQELRKSEESFRLLVEGVGDHAIYMLDTSGRVITWNPGAQRIKGWSAEEILGKHFSVFYLREDVATGQPERDIERATSEGKSQSEGWRVRAGGQRFWAETTLSALRDDAGTLRGFAKVTRDRTESLQTRAARIDRRAQPGSARATSRRRAPCAHRVASESDGGRNPCRGVVARWFGRRVGRHVRRRRRRVGAARHQGARRFARHHGRARRRETENVPDLEADLRVPRELPNTGMASGLFVPLHAGGETFGVIGVMMARGREAMQPHEADLLQAFGAQAAVSFAHARARRDSEQLHLVSERERIARDLHDSVIQRLFAVGLSLEATGRRPPGEMEERLHRAVADIDDTIRSIRSSIFSLEARPDEVAGLRSRVLEVVGESTPILGFEPSVRFEGPVDTLASDDITDNLVAVLREALSNIARHAHASSTRVTVVAEDDIVLIVDDDGVGATAFEREGGHGVTNLSERARMLGGRASITSLAPSGTRVDWRVPISQ